MFEYNIAQDLTARGIPFEYEAVKFKFISNVYNGQCKECGSNRVGSRRQYTTDFYLPEQNIYIEAKGHFTSEQRTKMINIKQANPEADIRMLFMHDNWISNKKHKRYSGWCRLYDYPYAFGSVPEEWTDGTTVM